jgi:hypothetical protein
MILLEQLYELYNDIPGDLIRDVEYCHTQGHVFLTEDSFIMGYEVGGRGWYVFAAVGNMGDMLASLPHYLPYIGFHRGKKTTNFHWYETDRLLRLI